jgi:DNA-binding CsgD family transcriptional regulator
MIEKSRLKAPFADAREAVLDPARWGLALETLSKALRAAQVLREGLVAGLNRLGVGILLVSADCRILFASVVVEAIMQRGEGLVCQNGHLRAMTPEASEQLERHIRAAASTGPRSGEEAGDIVTLPRERGLPIPILIVPFRRGEVALEPADPADPAAVLFVSDPEMSLRISERNIAQVYGLTPAETRLLNALIEGKRLSEYAKETGITLNTAKTYLRQLFDKTGSARQADLLRLILSDPILRLGSSTASARLGTRRRSLRCAR